MNDNYLDLAGMKIIEAPTCPKYELPPEVIPGVPWPKGFREEINKWSLEFFGVTSIIPEGTAYIMSGNNIAIMNPKDFVKIINIL